MTVCPIAIAVGCARCPAVKVCPLKGVLGDARPAEPVEPVKEDGPGRTSKKSSASTSSKAPRKTRSKAAAKSGTRQKQR